MEIVIATMAVLRQGDAILMLKRRPDDRWFADSWCFPGGRVDAGEDVEAALRREICEETGIDGVEIINEFGMMESPWPARERLYRVHCFGGIVGHRRVRLSAEHHAFRWISAGDEAPTPLAGNVTAHLLRAAFADEGASRLAPGRA